MYFLALLIAKQYAEEILNIVDVEPGIWLSDLYADLEIKDPKTGKPMNVSVKITRKEKQLIYEVDPTNIATCTTY